MPISDILSCPADEVQELLNSEEAYGRGAWMQAKNVFNIELSQLGEMIGAGTYDELMTGFEFVSNLGDDFDEENSEAWEPEGMFAEALPLPLVEGVARLTDDQIAKVAPQWKTIEEFSDYWTVEDLVDYLTRLRDFIRGQAGPFFLVTSV